jgi:hypothetical protein
MMRPGKLRDLAIYLLARRGQFVSRQELLVNVFGHQPDSTSRTVDAHMQRLLGLLNGEEEILSVRSRQRHGYILASRSDGNQVLAIEPTSQGMTDTEILDYLERKIISVNYHPDGWTFLVSDDTGEPLDMEPWLIEADDLRSAFGLARARAEELILQGVARG